MLRSMLQRVYEYQHLEKKCNLQWYDITPVDEAKY